MLTEAVGIGYFDRATTRQSKPPLDQAVSRIEVTRYFVDKLQPLIDQAIANRKATLTLEPNARYEQSTTLRIRSAKDLVIDGRGAMIVITDPLVDGVVIDYGQRLQLKNLSVDYDPLPFTQGVFIDADNDAATGDLKIAHGYSADASLFNAEPEKNGMNLWDPKTRLMRRDHSKHFVGKVTERRPGVLLVPSWNLKIGDLASLHVPWRGVAVRTDRSVDCILSNITVYAVPGGAFYCTGGEGGHKYLRCRVTRGPTFYGDQPRLYSANRDAFHAVALKRGPIIDGCVAEFMSDDAVNIHGQFVELAQRNQDWVQLQPAYPHQVGDRIDIHDQETLTRLVRSTVAELGNDPGWIRLHEVGEAKPGNIVIQPEHMCEGSVIRNCRFTDNVARGILCRASSSIIENNVIERPTISGIWIGPEIGFYREPGFPEKTVVRNNTLRDIGINARATRYSERLLGAISVLAGVDEPAQEKELRGQRLINQIEITGNRIEKSAAAGIFVANATNVVVRDNTMIETNRAEPRRLGALYGGVAPEAAVIIHDASNVTGSNNLVESPGKYFRRPLQFIDSADEIDINVESRRFQRED